MYEQGVTIDFFECSIVERDTVTKVKWGNRWLLRTWLFTEKGHNYNTFSRYLASS